LLLLAGVVVVQEIHLEMADLVLAVQEDLEPISQYIH
jgi:hypothetical protein